VGQPSSVAIGSTSSTRKSELEPTERENLRQRRARPYPIFQTTIDGGGSEIRTIDQFGGRARGR